MEILAEDLWKPVRGQVMYIVTTNGCVQKGRGLIMGAGAAKEAVRRYPDIEKWSASSILKNGVQVEGWLYRYVFLPVLPVTPEQPVGLGIFQAKLHFKHPSSLDLIRQSAQMLQEYSKARPAVRFRLNFPGIGLGGLSKDAVLPLLVFLPDNVTICYRS